MKIYEIGTGYTPIPAKMGAATEIVVEGLAKALLRQGKDVTVVDIQSKNRKNMEFPIIEVPVPKKFTGTDISLGIMHKLKRVIYSINLASILKKILNETNEKVVFHFHNQYNMFFFLKLTPKSVLNKCFLAYTNHSYIWHGNWSEISNTIKKKYFQEVFCMKHADRVYVLNKNTIATLKDHIGIENEKIQLIDNGVNTDIYSPISEKSKKEFKNKIGANEKRILIQVGSVCDRKNQLGALKLLLPFLKEHSDFVYWYAGGIIDDQYQDSLVQFVQKNQIEDQVKYLGEICPGNQLNLYYNISDAMVFPSKLEGFSLVIIEAMSAGVPVIVNKNLQFKLSDKCITYQNNDDFISVLQSNIMDDNKRKKLSVEVREIIQENYSWDKIANDYYKSWNEDE